MYKLKTTLFVLAALVMITPADAQAQSRSGVGIDTGGDKISAKVPEASRIFSSIDIVQDLQDGVINCAKLGLFYDQANNTCRQGVPPEVRFYRDGGTFVEVQKAYPNQDTIETYGNLDGKDGSVTLLD